LLAVAGCSAKYHEQWADKQVYAIIRARQKDVYGHEMPFKIAAPPDSLFAPWPRSAALEEVMSGWEKAREGNPAEGENGDGLRPIILSLADCLKIATRLNRDYQSQKETVYLAALALTAARYEFDPQWDAGGESTWNRTRVNIQDVDSSASLGVSQRLMQGAVITANIGLTALRYVNSELANQIQSTFNLSVSQPLWRGADPRVVQENLIQAERNALYAVRTYARFEKTFVVRVADSYFRVLERQDEVENNRQNYESLKASRKRAEWLARAGRVKQFQVDQTFQDELEAENRWVIAQETYAILLDEFKITLGLPTDAEIELDRSDLERLAEVGLQKMKIDVGEAVAKALKIRLDLANRRDGVDDAGRRAYVAKDDLKGDVTLVASWGVETPTETRASRLRWHESGSSVGLDFDLPLDRLLERNSYKSAQISLNRAIRSMTLKEDNVKLDVRTAYERLQRAMKSYEIQLLSVALAQRRVESTELLLEAGRAITRDVLEARRALVDAKNSLTQSLVDYTISRLEFLRDVGTLTVDNKGLFNDAIFEQEP
ncbi:MAG: TolC family protein, partial [Phycisphaerae bacterium]|nr:TolC family protein [Phycisphaerae bacterium]